MEHSAAVRQFGNPTGPAKRPLPSRPSPSKDWPSVAWLAHYACCARGRRCRRHVAFPEWWLLMVTRGIPYGTDADEALQNAVTRVNKFKGHPPLLPEPLLFTQQAVLDALCVAPAPVTESWVMGSLAAVGGLARWVHRTRQPLTREHVFSEETRYRWIGGAGHLTTESARIYAVRLELIADTLNGVTAGRRLPRATKVQEAPLEPLTLMEEADLWTWSRGLRPLTRRQRVQATLILGLGTGLTRSEKYAVRSEDVAVDADGVHVTLNLTNGATRIVTCRRDWEDRLSTIAFETPPEHLLMAPWRTTMPQGTVADEAMRRAHKYNPPAAFNNLRLRNTWLCRHLEAGTPLKVLMAAAGMAEANHLHKLLTLLPDVDPALAKHTLRDPR